MSTKQKQATLVLVRGLPGSGKSTIIAHVAKLLQSGCFIVLDPDKTDYSSSEYLAHKAQQKSKGVDEKLWPYRFLRAQSATAISQAKVVLWNQAFTNLDAFRQIISRHQEIASQAGVALRVLVVEVSIDPELARRRIAERVKQGEHDVAADRFENFVRDYRSFANLEFEMVLLEGADNPDKNAQKIVDALY